MEEQITIEHKIKIDSLMKVIGERDKNFSKYIYENFHPKKTNNIQIEENINALKYLNKNQQRIVKARAKEFEENNDLSKYVTPMIAFFVFMVGAYKLLAKLIVYKNLGLYLHATLALVLVMLVFYIFYNQIEHRSSAVYFNNLISNIEFDEEIREKKKDEGVLKSD